MSQTWLAAAEDWLGRYPHLVATFEACSTFAAVVVSLGLALLAQGATRTKLRATANLVSIYHNTIDPNDRPEYLSITITNIGVMPLLIPLSFFFFARR